MPINPTTLKALIDTQITNETVNFAITPAEVGGRIKDAIDYTTEQITGGGVTPDATISVKGKIQLAGDLAGTANSPTVPSLVNKEDLSNKSTNVTTDGLSDTKYPSVKSVKDYVDAEISAINPSSNYRELRGTLIQSSTGAPVLTIFKNDFVGTINLTRIGAGVYSLSIDGLVAADYLTKSYSIIGSSNSPIITRNEISVGSDGVGGYFFGIYSINVNAGGNVPVDNLLARTPLHIIIQD